MKTRGAFRKFQLKAMGFTAIFIAPVVALVTKLIYGYPFPKSVSETGTIANQTGQILPFGLGALVLFSLTYLITYAYDNLDKAFLSGMLAGFTMVAMQMCQSGYITVDRVGILGVSPAISHLIHCIGAVIGFGSMISWIMFCFRKSDKRREEQTVEKRLRNTVYFWLGVAMIASLLLFVVDSTGLFGSDFPIVYVCEAVMLFLGGIACLIKGEMFFADKAVK